MLPDPVVQGLLNHPQAVCCRRLALARLYLPPYSPDLKPIEKFFSKLKALLRKAAKRSIDALWEEIGAVLNAVSPDECANLLASCGYVSN
jgi:transposase